MFYGLSCAARFGVNIVNILLRIDCLLPAVYDVSRAARLQCHDITLDTTLQNRVSGVVQRGQRGCGSSKPPRLVYKW